MCDHPPLTALPSPSLRFRSAWHGCDSKVTEPLGLADRQEAARAEPGRWPGSWLACQWNPWEAVRGHASKTGREAARWSARGTWL